MSGGLSEWRLIDADGEQDNDARAPAPGQAHREGVSRQVLAGLAAIALLIVAAAIWATMPAGGVVMGGPDGQAIDARSLADRELSDPVQGGTVSPAPVMVASLFVDVEGAVVSPGVHELREGSRVSDAIAAAGGYSASVDIAAASTTLNLAAPLTDGVQIHVPALGEMPLPTRAPGAPSVAGPSDGLIDVNKATADQLDTLPGIGPVTAAKIIDARAEAPFATIDELQSRGVVGPSTFEKIRDLVTVAP